MKLRKMVENITTVVIAGMCLVFCALFFILPKKDYSENENRYLAKLSAPTAGAVKDGTYMDSLTEYAVDHFPLRDSFVGLKTIGELSIGKKQIGNIFVASDDYYIEAYLPQKETEVRAGILKQFLENDALSDIQCVLMLVPTASYIYADKLPAFAPVPAVSQTETMDMVYEITGALQANPTENLLAHKEEYIYYKLDHHWTSLGAYYGYETYCETANLTKEPIENFVRTDLSDAFYGTIYSKVNAYAAKGDQLTAYSYPGDQLCVTYEDTAEVADTLFNPVYLEMKDKYSYFLNNLHSLITVENKNATTGRVLVLLKDSYANCMVPFLAHHYDKIYIFDTRSYKAGVIKFVKEHPEITDLLLIYNMNTFDTDLGIKAVY